MRSDLGCDRIRGNLLNALASALHHQALALDEASTVCTHVHAAKL